MAIAFLREGGTGAGNGVKSIFPRPSSKKMELRAGRLCCLFVAAQFCRLKPQDGIGWDSADYFRLLRLGAGRIWWFSVCCCCCVMKRRTWCSIATSLVLSLTAWVRRVVDVTHPSSQSRNSGTEVWSSTGYYTVVAPPKRERSRREEKRREE